MKALVAHHRLKVKTILIVTQTATYLRTGTIGCVTSNYSIFGYAYILMLQQLLYYIFSVVYRLVYLS